MFDPILTIDICIGTKSVESCMGACDTCGLVSLL